MDKGKKDSDKLYKLIVTWIDAYCERGVKELHELLDLKPLLVESIGFGKEFEDRVVLATDRWLNKEGTETRDIQVIPRECIKSIRKVR